MKKLVSIILITMLLATLVAGCGGQKPTESAQDSQDAEPQQQETKNTL